MSNGAEAQRAPGRDEGIANLLLEDTLIGGLDPEQHAVDLAGEGIDDEPNLGIANVAKARRRVDLGLLLDDRTIGSFSLRSPDCFSRSRSRTTRARISDGTTTAIPAATESRSPVSRHRIRHRFGLQLLRLHSQLRDLLAQRRRSGCTRLKASRQGFTGLALSAPATAASRAHPRAPTVAASTPRTLPLTTTASGSTWTGSAVLHRHTLFLLDSGPAGRLSARWSRLGTARPSE
jgi:hypothetical protein